MSFNNMRTLKCKTYMQPECLHFLPLSITIAEASEDEDIEFDRVRRSCFCLVIGGFQSTV